MNYDDIKAIEASWDTPKEDFTSADPSLGGWGEPISTAPTPILCAPESSSKYARSRPNNNSSFEERRDFGSHVQPRGQSRDVPQPTRDAPAPRDINNPPSRPSDHHVNPSQASFESVGGSRQQAIGQTNQSPRHAPSPTAPKGNASRDTCTLEWQSPPPNTKLPYVLELFSEVQGSTGIQVQHQAQGGAIRLTFGTGELARRAYQIFREINLPGSLIPVFEDSPRDNVASMPHLLLR